ncbi:MAG: hypothetical protein Q4E53_01605 [Eubacteriales bacterium]|nr:hypothetical protein [Eubacteriales bacterium]
MKFRKSLIALACFMVLSFVTAPVVNAADFVATQITTPEASLPKETDEAKTIVKINSKNGYRTFKIYGQHRNPYKKDKYLEMHGCALCSLTTGLAAYLPNKFGNYTPYQVRTKVEKKVFGAKIYKANYSKKLRSQMPVSMYGISKIFKSMGIKTKYVRKFSNASAEKEIETHLKTGNIVYIESNDRPQVNGKYGKCTKKWSSSKHTMILLGMTDTGKVIVSDSSDRKWSKKNQRIKYTTVKEIVSYLIPCKSSAKTCYFSKTAACGGYVLINPQK